MTFKSKLRMSQTFLPRPGTSLVLHLRTGQRGENTTCLNHQGGGTQSLDTFDTDHRMQGSEAFLGYETLTLHDHDRQSIMICERS